MQINDMTAEQKRAIVDAYIRPSEALPQAQAMQQDIFTYAPRSNGAKDYQKLYDEIRKDL